MSEIRGFPLLDLRVDFSASFLSNKELELVETKVIIIETMIIKLIYD